MHAIRMSTNSIVAENKKDKNLCKRQLSECGAEWVFVFCGENEMCSLRRCLYCHTFLIFYGDVVERQKHWTLHYGI